MTTSSKSPYRNRFEARCARDLGSDYSYETLKLRYTIEHTYLADFRLVDGKHVVEAKGYFPAEDRRKMLAVKRANPEYTFEIWFSDPTRTITKLSKTSYGEWATKHGFSWRSGPAS